MTDVYSRMFDGRAVQNGEMVIFECLGGSTLVGVNSTFCIRGEYIHDIPTCQSKSVICD